MCADSSAPLSAQYIWVDSEENQAKFKDELERVRPLDRCIQALHQAAQTDRERSSSLTPPLLPN